MKSMKDVGKNGFRLLDEDELEAVHGRGDIVVTGDRYGDDDDDEYDEYEEEDEDEDDGDDDGDNGGSDYEHCDGSGNETSGEGQGPDVDAAAQEAAGDIVSALGDTPGVIDPDERREFGSIVYEDSNGEIQTFGPVELDETGEGSGTFSTDPLIDAFQAAGLSGESIRGFVHNHPFDVNDDPLTARYPTFTDWTSTAFTGIGANISNYSLYIVDPLGTVREFSYADQDLYAFLTDQEMRDGVALPEGTEAGNGCDGGGGS